MARDQGHFGLVPRLWQRIERRELPAAAGDVTADALYGQMTAEANFGMSQNAACPIGTADLAEIAAAVLALPKQEATA